MPKLRAIVIGLLVGIAFYLLPLELAWSIDQLKVEDNPNADLLPYSFTVEKSNDFGMRKLAVGNQIQVLHAQMGPSDTAWYIHAFNGDLNQKSPAVLSLEMYAHGQVVDWNPLNLTLTNFALFRDSGSGQTGVVALGYRNDSAYAAISMLGSDNYDFILLATGEDHSGDDQWVAGVAPLLVEDYDYDGHDELFLWVGPGRDLEPRVLVCLEPDTRSIEWSLPVAGSLSSPSFYSCRDSVNPSVIFATYNLKNGVVDDNFDDNFCWLARVNNRGEILHRRIISEEHGGKGLWPGESDSLFYVFHALPMVAPEDSAQLPPQRYQLSRIDSDFHQLASVDLDDRIVSAWWDTYDPAGERSFYTLSTAGLVRVYDSLLNLLAISGETPLRRFVDTFRLEGMDETAYLFRTGSGMQFYSRQFEHLGTIDAVFNQVQALVNDDRSCVTHLVATDANVNRVYSISRLEFSDFARLLFWKYQEHFLITLTVLALALIIVNIFRQRAARRLAQSERRLHEFFETSQDGFYRTDSEGRFIWGSEATFRILGYDSIEDVMGTRVVDHYVDPAKRQQLLEQMQRDGQVSDYEVELRKQDGSTVVVSTSSAFYRDESGRVMGVEGVFRDITERSLAERALAESEERYRSLIESSSEAIFSLNREGQFLFMNMIAAKRLGGIPSDYIGKKMWNFFPKEMADSQMESILKVLDTGEGLVKESEVEMRGKLRQYITSIEPVRDTTGRVVAATAFARDITELYVVRRQLESEKDFVRSLLDTANSLIVCLNNEARITVFNKGCEMTTGYLRDEVIGLSWPEVFLPKESIHEGLNNFTQWVRENPQDTYEGPLRTKSGEIRTILWSNSAILGSSSQQFVAIAVGQDITDKKLAEDALRESEAFNRAVIEHSPLGVTVRSRAGKLLSYNEAWRNIWQISAEDLHEYTTRERYVLRFDKRDAYLGDWTEKVRLIYEEGGYLHIPEIEVKNQPKHEHLWLSHHFYALKDSNDQVDRVVVLTEDITERKLAEERLRIQSEIMKNMAEGVYLVGADDGIIRYCNPEIERMFGYSPGEMNGKHASIVNAPGDPAPDETAKEIMGILRDTGEWHGDINNMNKDGTSFWCHASCSTFQHPEFGRVIVAVHTDITERKLAEDALRESGERYHGVFNESIATIYLFDAEKNFVDTNQSGLKLLGYSRDELLRLNISDVDADPSEVAPAHKQLLSGDRILNFEHRLKRKDGSIITVLNNSKPLTDAQGCVIGLQSTLIDITDRKRAEDALRESEERFRTLAEATPISLVVTSAEDSTIMYANRATGEMLGFPQSELIDMKAADRYLNPTDRVAALKILRETGQVSNFETRLSRADGSYLWGLISLRPITFQGKPALFGALVDITDRREAQQKLREAEKARYDQVKQIAGGVAHEIYNALFPATSCLAKLGERLPESSTADDDRNRKLLHLAESAVGRAIDMTDLVTRYSRLDSERIEEAVTLRPLLEEILESNAERIDQLQVDIQVAVADDVVVSCRSAHLHSIFSNLLINALDALEEVSDRQIKVVASEDSEWVRIRFSDTGPGIPSEHQPRIFEPFFSTKPTRGTGLGLAIVKRIVELYYGRIELEHTVDKGSIFVILLKSARIDPSKGDR